MTTTTSPAPTVGAAPAERPRRSVGRAGRWRPRPWEVRAAELFVVAAVCLVPLLAVRPGVVTSDTKTYLYLDPARFLSQVASLWNPTVALGTVTHEYVGYLLPMGPYYAATAALHVPTWIAQRLWLGGILFAAGAGVLFLCRVLAVRGPGRLVAALAFALSPYFLQYAGRISVILLPWAGLPWMVAFTVLAARRGGWRDPARFALVMALVSGINASSVLYVGLAPALWLVYAAAVEREVSWRRAVAVALRVGVLAAAVSAWWIAGLTVEAAYGIDILKYTETVPSTSQTSSAAEVLRGLGYWYFYGGDRLGPWTRSAVLYTQAVWVVALSFAVPALSFLAAALVRWRHRAYFVLLVVVGTVCSVGAFPYAHPTPAGGLLKAFMTDTTAGLAMRSTDRATPLVVLGLAMLLGAGASAVWARLPRIGLVTGLAAAALVVANNPALFNGDAQVASTFHQPASLPSYELAALRYLNSVNQGTRVLAIPGNDFAAYRWGNTVDTPQPSVLTRPFVTREQQVMGSMATADTLYALDAPIQTGIENWSALAPMARLMSAGNLLVEYDQAYEHYGTPQPKLLAASLAQTPPGLTNPRSFGRPRPNLPVIPTLNEADLAATPNLPWPSPLVTYTIPGARPIARGESDQGALVVAGDATGLESLAGAGMLDTTSAVYYAGTLDRHPAELHRLLAGGATLVVTNSNKARGVRWDTLTANYGYTQTPLDHPSRTDPSDSPIDLFPGAPAGARTYAAYTGALDVTASSYGNPVSYTPEYQPYGAIDGNLDTAWETGTFLPDPARQWWQVRFTGGVTAGQVTLVQPQQGTRSRWITKVTLHFDGGSPVTARLGSASRTPAGQTLTFPTRTFHTLRVTIDATSNDHAAPAAASAVGFAEVQVPGVSVTEVTHLPTDLLSAAGTASLGHRLVVTMTRERVSPYPPRSDPQLRMVDQFTLPTARTFTLSGTASLSTLMPDDEIDRLVGMPGTTGSGVVAYSSGRLPGDLQSTAAAAADGNPQTAWQPGFGAAAQKGSWLQYVLPAPITFDHMTLQVVADGRHSVPTAFTVTAQSATGGHTVIRTVTLPHIGDGTAPGSTVTVPVHFPAVTGQRIRVTFTGVRLERTTNYYSSKPTALPLGIAEVGIPGLRTPPVPAALPGTCQSNLVTIDGRPVTVRIVGATATALTNGTVQVQPCGADAGGITLGPGTHVVATSVAHNPLIPNPVDCTATASCSGWNIDRLTLDSAAGGGAEPPAAGGTTPGATLAPPVPGPAPRVVTASQAATSRRLTVSRVSSPFELVLGESLNAGWHAVAHPVIGAPAGSHSVDLGTPQLVDAFANGWQVGPGALTAVGATGAGGTGAFTVSLTWTPQRREWTGLAVSGAALVLCLLLAFLPARRRSAGRAGRRSSWRRWRRWRRRPRHRAAADADGVARGPGMAAVAREGPVPAAADASPLPGWPFARRGRRPRWWTLVLVAVATGGVAGAISTPLVGAAAGVAVAAALAVPQCRAVTAGVAVGLVVAAGAVVVAGQLLHPVAESSDWPAAYASAGVLAWMAVAFLGADAVAERGRTARRRRGGGGAPPPAT